MWWDTDWGDALGSAVKNRQDSFANIGNLGDQLGELDIGQAFSQLADQRMKQFTEIFAGSKVPNTTDQLVQAWGNAVGQDQLLSTGLSAMKPQQPLKKGIISSLWDSVGDEVLGALL
jgi:hypothetical protein